MSEVDDYVKSFRDIAQCRGYSVKVQHKHIVDCQTQNLRSSLDSIWGLKKLWVEYITMIYMGLITYMGNLTSQGETPVQHLT